MTTAAEATSWLLSKRGLSGRSPNRATRLENAKLLMPHDDLGRALSTLDHWIDAKTGETKVMSTCALFAMAYLRDCLGLAHPLLDRPYLGHNDAPQIVRAVAQSVGAWIDDHDERLCALPDVGNVVRIGMDGESPIHFACVADVADSDSALICVAGGGGDGSLIHESNVIMVIWRGLPYLVDAAAPYKPGGEPNGRRISGRAVLPC